MPNVTVRFLFCVVLAFTFGGTALAQSEPSPTGTWKGTFNGADTGTLTITIDSSQNVTVNAFSKKYGKYFIATGSLVKLPSTMGWKYSYFLASTSGDTFPSRDFLSVIVYSPDSPVTIAGTWGPTASSDSTEQGDFTAKFVSGSPDGGPTTFNLGGYMSGSWYNSTPGQSGHGFSVEFTDQENTVIAYWFTYTPNGKRQSWIYAQGTYDISKNTVTIPAIRLTGAMFPPDFDSSQLTRTPWGTITFTFSDCNTGTASWKSTLGNYGSGSFPITRMTSIAGTSCP